MKNIIIILSCITLLSCKSELKSNSEIDQNIESFDLKVSGVQINVTNIDKAVNFYSDKIGFIVKSQTTSIAELQNNGITLLLNKVLRLRKNNFPEESRTHLVLHTNNLDSIILKYKSMNIFFVVGKTENGVGYAAIFEDPFGNKISLMEQSKYPVPRFKEPMIYNTGYSMDDLEKAKQFYCQRLGFYVRTTKYLPALPLGHSDSTFAFMLHKKNVKPTKYDPNETQVMIVFNSTNIESTIKQLKKEGITVDVLKGSANDSQKSYYITDPFGNICKIIRAVPNKK